MTSVKSILYFYKVHVEILTVKLENKYNKKNQVEFYSNFFLL